MTGPEFAAARKSLGLTTQVKVCQVFGRSLTQIKVWEKNGPDELGARYMQALLATGWRPDDWPK